MTRQITLMIAAVAILVGCNQHPAATAGGVVAEKELVVFLAHAKTGDFHDVSRAGKALLKPGLLIPNHKTTLKDFPSGHPEGGQVRYELMSFQREGSAGGINLFLKAETGEIIQFLSFEATP